MSSQSRPISPTQFAFALQDLPTENLYIKVSEIRNSVAHLIRSNKELQDYLASAGEDADCVAAIRENEAVAKSMEDRITLVKKEVERRGQRWHEAALNRRHETAESEKTQGESAGIHL